MPTPTTVGASDVALDAQANSAQFSFQRASFFALGRHWVFYVRAGVIPVLVWRSSVGATEAWTGDSPFIPLATGAEFTLWVQETSPTTAFVHLVWADATGPNPIQYARGTLAAVGTIAWDPVQTVLALEAGYEYENLGICMSFATLPQIFVVYNRVEIADVTNTTPYITMSTTVDGTWSQGAGYPMQLTGVTDPAWVPLVAPYGTEVITVYAFPTGNIYSRLLSGGAWGVQVDSGFDIGADARRMSIVSERYRATSQAAFTSRAVYLAYQGTDWDLYSIRYESAAWQGAPANTIQSIGNFRTANPLLSIMYTGDEDATVDDHLPATLYCFWTPTTDIPTAEWVTYRVSRDLGDTWTNEAGADAAVSWIDETSDGFEVQESGSSYYHSSEYYDGGVSYIGVVYVTHRMPPALRHAALAFDDPTEDLYCLFNVLHSVNDVELYAQFEIRRDSPADPAPDLLGIFTIRPAGSEDLLGIFNALNLGSEDLWSQFNARHADTANLFGIFIVTTPDSEDLFAIFTSRQADNEDLFAQFFVNQDSEDLLGIFMPRRAAAANLLGIFRVVIPDSEDFFAIFNVRQAASEDLYGMFEIRRSASEDLLAFFRIDQDYISKGLNVSVYQDLGVIQ